ncbi:FecR domain-containing protein [Acidovorax cavernicola]|uniref:LysM peptidoglycan-binding domain-containing protein n=1 Tax=Acidovorax cavernicola TaxID=1675792 RepID=A0A9X8D2S3_9BURK|nr:FecR domain-containing protein [Acidovorax cavernicola]RIX76780.1 LysM peptidoglycan-binding domain-containing protein [Acidovorax cavernicola]
MPTNDIKLRLRRLVACAGLVATAAANAQAPHVVKPGETLWGISGQQLSTPLRWPEVQERNQVGEPRLLQPGTVLYFADGRLVPEGAAVVAAVEGQASRQRAGGAEQTLTPGMPIQAGDTLITGTDAFVTLGLTGGSRIVLPSRSALEVLAIDATTVRLRLIKGRVESQVQKQQPNQQFEIRARSMGLGVRGTHFRVRDEDGLLTGEVISGEVVVERTAQATTTASAAPAEPPLVLRAGSGAVLLDNGPSVARGLLPAPQLLNETAQRSNRTFRFSPVPGAQTYRLQLARDERFLLPVHEQRGPGPSFEVPAELEPGFYQLRLTAFDAARLEGLPGDSTIYLPASAGSGTAGQGTSSVLSDGRVEVRWPGVAGQRYAFELSRSADFAVLLVNEPAVYATGMTLGPFALGGRYHWRARQATADSTAPAAAGFSGSFDIPAR